MKARTIKRRVQALQLASSRLGECGKAARFYGGAKWTRRQRARMAVRPSAPLSFNRIVLSAQ